MPSIDVAMEMSLRRRVFDVLADGMRPALLEDRGIVSDAQSSISDVTTAFSSWDNCMAASFCKWPVIAVIVIGGLIILSVVWCLARCLCCGVSCCCECFYCLKCCGNCCGCCDPPKGRKHKYLDEPYIPPNQGYHPEAPMSTGAIPAPAPAPAPQTRAAAPPQYAQYAEFDVSKKAAEHEDALPAMPSWEGSESKKVEVHTEAVELDLLKKPEANGGQNVPLMAGVSPAASVGPATPLAHDARSPYGAAQGTPGASPYGPAQSTPGASPYDAQRNQGAASGYFSQENATATDTYGLQQAQNYNHGNYDQGSNGMRNQGHDQSSNAYEQSQRPFGDDQDYAMAGGSMAGDQGQGYYSARGHAQRGYTQSPVQVQGQSYRGVGSPPPLQQGYNGYEQNGSVSSGLNQPYGMGHDRRSPSAPPQDGMGGGYPDHARGSPAPRSFGYNDGNYNERSYSPAPPHRQYSADSSRAMPPAPYRQYSRGLAPQRQFSADSATPLGARQPPRRQYSNDVAAASMSPGLRNNAGFDFNSGNSRPPTYDPYGRSKSTDSQQQQQQQEQQRPSDSAYPGYKPYTPAS